MRCRLTVSARTNILGNPSGAKEGDFATISAAVDVRAGAIVEPALGLALESLQRTDGELATSHCLKAHADDVPLPYDGELGLLQGAINSTATPWSKWWTGQCKLFIGCPRLSKQF